MLFSYMYGKLILLTKRNDITFVEIANCIGIQRGAMFARAKRNSNMKDEEIKKIEEQYKVNLNSIITVDNSFTKQSKFVLNKKISNFSIRLCKIQASLNLSDRDFAKILGVYVDELTELKSNEKEPNLKILNNLKQNFNVSIDWLLYGD